MKLWKTSLRIWITITSLLSFMGGWAVLAHSPKPNQFNPASMAQMPVLEPVPSLDQMIVLQQTGSNSFAQNVRPIRLRTGGS